MGVIGTRLENPNLGGAILCRPRDDQRCGALIMGSRRTDVFVATDVFISADTLGDEEAIRAWLAQHDIRLVLPPSNAASTQKDSTEAVGP